MGYKYQIDVFNHPYKGYSERDYGSRYFITFIVKLMYAICEYDGVNVYVRK